MCLSCLFCERTNNLFSCLLINFCSPACMSFFFLSTQFTGAMEWLPVSPGVAPELQVCRLEVAELSVAVEGDSPWWNINVSPCWFTAVWPNMTQYWTNWRTSVSLQFAPHTVTETTVAMKRYYKFPIRKWIITVRLKYSANHGWQRRKTTDHTCTHKE